MSLVSDVKGRFAESLIGTLLENAGYRVMGFGVEVTIGEVKAAHARREERFELPEQVQAAPDFIVVSVVDGSSWMVEVKFRSCIDDRALKGLHSTLARQARHWPDLLTIIVTANPPGLPGDRYQDYIRVVAADRLDDLTRNAPAAARWAQFGTLGQ